MDCGDERGGEGQGLMERVWKGGRVWCKRRSDSFWLLSYLVGFLLFPSSYHCRKWGLEKTSNGRGFRR